MTATILYFPTSLKMQKITYPSDIIETENSEINKLYLRMNENKHYKSVLKNAWKNNKQYSEPYLNADEDFPFQLPLRTSIESIKGEIGCNLNKCDPLAFLDRKYKTTLSAIKMHKDAPLIINTRSDLITTDEYIECIQKHHVINICYKSLDESESKMLDPGAPSIKRRKKAYYKLKALGYSVHFIKENKAA